MKINRNAWKSQALLFLSAQTISLFGSSIVQYAIIWYVTLTTSSGTMMMVATICAFLPQVVISIFAGVWVDRYDRKKLIMLSDSIIALSTLILAIIFLSGFKSITMLFIVLAIRSAGTGIQIPAVSAIIPQITPKKMLMRINGIYSSINSLMMFLSPAASGAILSVASIETTFFIDVVTAFIGVGIMSFLSVRKLRSKGLEESKQIDQLKEGFRYLKNHNFIMFLLIFQIIVLFVVSPAAFLTPLMVKRSFGPEVWRLMVNEMLFGGGAVIGGMIIAWWGGFNNRMLTTIVACICYGFLTIAMGLSPNFIVYSVFNFIIGLMLPFYSSPITVLLQEKVSKNMHGRVFSFMQIATSCALPLGMVFFGPLADIISVQKILIGCGIVLSIYSLYTWHLNKTKYSLTEQG